MTCLRQEGKVILPLRKGDLTISLVISLHLLQTQAQATTFWRWGQLSSVVSTRLMISPSNSGSNPAHDPEEWATAAPESIDTDVVDDTTESSAASSSVSFEDLCASPNDLEILRERHEFLRDIFAHPLLLLILAFDSLRESERDILLLALFFFPFLFWLVGE